MSEKLSYALFVAKFDLRTSEAHFIQKSVVRGTAADCESLRPIIQRSHHQHINIATMELIMAQILSELQETLDERPLQVHGLQEGWRLLGGTPVLYTSK